MRKTSIMDILSKILDAVESGVMPDRKLIKQGRAVVKERRKRAMMATRAAAESGNSGRRYTLAEDQRYKIACTPGTLAEVAKAYKIGTTTVHRFRQEFPDSETIRNSRSE